MTASFAIDTYTLTYAAAANGSLTGASPQTVNNGANGSEVIAVPDAGYHFTSWSDASTTATRTDTNVTGDVTVTASFAIDIVQSSGGGGPVPVKYLTPSPLKRENNSISTLPVNPTSEDYQNLIITLLRQIDLLRAQMSQGQTINIPDFPNTGSTYLFSDNLEFGSSGNAVEQLQLFLKARGLEIYPSGLVTGYFGTLTKKAVKAFQLKYGIAGSGDSGYGFVGPRTRAKINQMQES